MNDIIINNLSKTFGDKTVLADFSEIIPAHKTTAIMGESGIGKTTLINIIMGLEKADSGEISGVPDKISAVFQEDCLCEDFSAISNIRAVTGKKISKENISSTLKELGLSSNDLTFPSRELSGGMKRRVAIARALLAESDLIIMDEPFKGLDIETRSSVIKVILNSISQSKRTLIIITHSPEEAELLSSDKIIVIH